MISDHGKVSIIVPIYNVELYLEECVRSLMNQTYRNLEILLIDDGSTDESGNIADRFAATDDRIQVFHKENGGLSSARNVGLQHASGDYFAFVDSDDYTAGDYIEKLLGCLVENKADIALCNFNISLCGRVIPSERLMNYKNGTVFTSDSYLDEFYTYCGSFAVAWNKLYRREIFEGLEYALGIQGEDAHILLYLMDRCDRIVYLAEELYFYRQRKSSIMSGNKEKLLLSDMNWLEEHMSKLKAEDRKHALSMAQKLYIVKIEKMLMFCSDEAKKSIISRMRPVLKEFLKSSEFSVPVKLKLCLGYIFPNMVGKHYEKVSYDSDEIWP